MIMIMMMTMKWFGAVPIIIKSKLPGDYDNDNYDDF